MAMELYHYREPYFFHEHLKWLQFIQIEIPYMKIPNKTDGRSKHRPSMFVVHALIVRKRHFTNQKIAVGKKEKLICESCKVEIKLNHLLFCFFTKQKEDKSID